MGSQWRDPDNEGRPDDLTVILICALVIGTILLACYAFGIDLGEPELPNAG